MIIIKLLTNVFFSIRQQLRLLVATEDGLLFVYNIDPNEGGDLTLYKQHCLDDGPGNSSKNTDTTDDTQSAPRNIETGK